MARQIWCHVISQIDGLDLFASEDIAAGTYAGETHVKINEHQDWLRTPLGGFINHEKTIKEPNSEGKDIEVSGPNCKRIKNRIDGCVIKYSLITRRDIKAGEELTLEYSMYVPVK